MPQSDDTEKAIEKFLAGWENDPWHVKEAFVRIKSYLEEKGDISFDFNFRPNISHSLRASHEKDRRPLFAIIDIIEDEPRWLSVCFYNDTVTDPGELGNPIPESLLDEDGYCFDVDLFDDTVLSYIEKRIDEAYAAASTAAEQ